MCHPCRGGLARCLLQDQQCNNNFFSIKLQNLRSTPFTRSASCASCECVSCVLRPAESPAAGGRVANSFAEHAAAARPGLRDLRWDVGGWNREPRKIMLVRLGQGHGHMEISRMRLSGPAARPA